MCVGKKTCKEINWMLSESLWTRRQRCPFGCSLYIWINTKRMCVILKVYWLWTWICMYVYVKTMPRTKRVSEKYHIDCKIHHRVNKLTKDYSCA